MGAPRIPYRLGDLAWDAPWPGVATAWLTPVQVSALAADGADPTDGMAVTLVDGDMEATGELRLGAESGRSRVVLWPDAVRSADDRLARRVTRLDTWLTATPAGIREARRRGLVRAAPAALAISAFWAAGQTLFGGALLGTGIANPGSDEPGGLPHALGALGTLALFLAPLFLRLPIRATRLRGAFILGFLGGLSVAAAALWRGPPPTRPPGLPWWYSLQFFAGVFGMASAGLCLGMRPMTVAPGTGDDEPL